MRTAATIPVLAGVLACAAAACDEAPSATPLPVFDGAPSPAPTATGSAVDATTSLDATPDGPALDAAHDAASTDAPPPCPPGLTPPAARRA